MGSHGPQTLQLNTTLQLGTLQDDAADAKWFPVGQLPSLAFDHKLVVRTAFEKLAERGEVASEGATVLVIAFLWAQPSKESTFLSTATAVRTAFEKLAERGKGVASESDFVLMLHCAYFKCPSGSRAYMAI